MLKFIANFERSVSIELAEQLILAEGNSIALAFGCELLHYTKGSTDVVHASLPSGEDLAYGLGKGIHSKVGAYAECLEHLLYTKVGRSNVRASVTKLKSAEVSRVDPVLGRGFSIDDIPEELEVVEFTDVTTGALHQVPTALINHHLLDGGLTLNGIGGSKFEVFLSRYVTTSGAAFGLTQDDAYLHALNETIERDTTSKLFLAIVGVTQSANHFQRIALDSLPGYLGNLCNDITTRFGALSIELIVTRTASDTWWSMCIARFQNQDIYELPQWGAGSSRLYDLAIYRSISECIQMLDNFEIENLAADRKLIEFTTRFPRFKAIPYFDLTAVPIAETAYDRDRNIGPEKVTTQIEKITAAMRSEGHMPLKHLAYIGENSALVCAYTPTFERFYNITKASPVLPLAHLRIINGNQA